ncbi:MAG: LuxR C-terminal-related transcriptional regulator, partial [Actinomycetota bacterium]|nr:LuxR C-terminal-related transcriptional regulator [Actinomycetota bacterium]
PRYEAVVACHRGHDALLSGAPAARVGELIEAALAGGGALEEEAVFSWAILCLILAERDGAALAHIDAALANTRARGRVAPLPLLYAHRAHLAYGRGAVADALADADVGLNAVEGFHLALPLLHAARVDALRERGELDEANDALDRARLGEIVVDQPGFGLLLISRARLRLAQGRPELARDDLLHCGALHERWGADLLVNPGWRAYAAMVLASLGHRDEAEPLAMRQLELARSFGAPRALGLALRAAGSVRGGERGLGLLEESAAVLDGSSTRLELARTLVEWGILLGKVRGRRESHEPLRRAVAIAHECGATALADEARGELTAGGGRPPSLKTKGAAALTPAERRVATLAADELSNREIAQTLFVTEKTVEVHLSRAYRKLGVRSRWQLRRPLGLQDATPAEPPAALVDARTATG